MSEKLIKDLEEVVRRLPNFRFCDENLPDRIPPLQTVTLPRERLEKFRLSYDILLESLAKIIGKDHRELCVLDLIHYFYKNNEPQKKGVGR